MAGRGRAWRGKGTEFHKWGWKMTRLARDTAQPKEVTRELVSQWEEKWPCLRLLNNATLDKARGFSISIAECERICGDKKTFRKISSYWKRCVMWLLGITVEYEHTTKSYRFIEVERHFVTRNGRIMRAAERRHREESLRLALIRNSDLETDHRRAMRVLLMNQHNDTAGKIEAQREHARIALAAPETLPTLPMAKGGE